MPAPRKYPLELRERAIRMAVDARQNPTTRDGAIARVADQLGINRETLRNWVTQAEVVAYCRGRCCVLSYHAVRLLHAHGRRASLLEEGILEWRSEGLPIAA